MIAYLPLIVIWRLAMFLGGLLDWIRHPFSTF